MNQMRFTDTHRRSPRKRQQQQQHGDFHLCLPIRKASPVVQSYPRKKLKQYQTEEASSSSSSSCAAVLEYKKPESPSSHRLKVVLDSQEGGLEVLEYEETNNSNNNRDYLTYNPTSSVKRVRVVYSSAVNSKYPSIPTAKSILRRSGSTSTKSSADSTPNQMQLQEQQATFSLLEMNYRMSILFPQQHEQLLTTVRQNITLTLGVTPKNDIQHSIISDENDFWLLPRLLYLALRCRSFGDLLYTTF
jgi:hypothetical protein